MYRLLLHALAALGLSRHQQLLSEQSIPTSVLQQRPQPSPFEEHHSNEPINVRHPSHQVRKGSGVQSERELDALELVERERVPQHEESLQLASDKVNPALGEFGPVIEFPLIPVAAALLPDGKVRALSDRSLQIRV